MWELRWVLLGLGALLVLGLYLWGTGTFPFAPRRSRHRGGSEKNVGEFPDSRRRTEPAISAKEPIATDGRAEPEIGDLGAAEDMESDGERNQGTESPAEAPTPDALPEKIVALRFIPRGRELGCALVVRALRAAGLRHGRYGIFHRLTQESGDNPLFSVASLTEPGSFDLSRLEETTLPGMSFFLIIPGPGDPVERFDDMVETARGLAHDLDAELYDDGGSSWSVQRERYIREELIRYRHERASSAPDEWDRRIDRLS